MSYCNVSTFFNIKTDTVVMLITKKFTAVQVFDVQGFYCVLDEPSISDEVVVWEMQLTVSFSNKLLEANEEGKQFIDTTLAKRTAMKTKDIR